LLANQLTSRWPFGHLTFELGLDLWDCLCRLVSHKSSLFAYGQQSSPVQLIGFTHCPGLATFADTLDLLVVRQQTNLRAMAGRNVFPSFFIIPALTG